MTETMPAFEDLVADLSPVPSSTRVVTATIVAATADVATLRTNAGYEAIMPVTEFYPNRRWAVGQIYQLLQLGEGPRPMLSAIRPELVEAALMGVCPELRSGTVRVMGIARSPGVRTKLSVAPTEAGVDAVAACVGRGANRVKALIEALAGERVDVIPWHPDVETYLKNALAPAAVTEVRIEGKKATAVAPSHMMSAAVGGAGLNSALAGKLTGLHVVIADS